MDINVVEQQSNTPELISGTMLVIATIMGGEMFPLSAAMADVWSPGTPIILLFIAIMVLLIGLTLVEVDLHYDVGISFNTFTQDLLGRKWSTVIDIVSGFVLYILTYAYTSGSSAVMTQTVFKYSGVHLLASIPVAIVSMLVGAVAWYNSLLVGRITTVLIIGKFIAFFITFSGLAGHTEVAKPVDDVVVTLPNSQYLSYILMTLPSYIISPGFHGSMSNLVKLYGKSGVLNITRLIIIGMLFALLPCIFWLDVMVGNINRSAFSPIVAKGDSIDVLVGAISELFTNRHMGLIPTFFDNSVVTSFLLVATPGLFDCIVDLLYFPDDDMGRPKTALVTYFPLAAVYLFFSNGFAHATGYTDLASTIWSVILPPFLVKAVRKHLPIASYTVPRNSIVFDLVIIREAVVHLTVVLDVLGLLSTSRQTELK